ncbi:ATP synthase, subunit E [Dermacentor variabilis]|uniref:ATP synthase, subunit E n=1 Tax=Dermacentor variabilis TaxID=34621 RepID=UPI003F5C766F
MVELAPPVSVSPFIRACRWGFLTAGIFYGAFNYRRLSRKETKIREYEAQQMEMLKSKKEAEKKKLQREEMINLAKDVGVPVPPNF